MYSDPSSLSTYRVIAEPLDSIGEVKSSLITFSPTTPLRKMRCSFDSSKAFETRPLIETFEIVDFSSWPFIVAVDMMGSMRRGTDHPLTRTGLTLSRRPGLPPSRRVPSLVSRRGKKRISSSLYTGDIFSSVRLILYARRIPRCAHSADRDTGFYRWSLREETTVYRRTKTSRRISDSTAETRDAEKNLKSPRVSRFCVKKSRARNKIT